MSLYKTHIQETDDLVYIILNAAKHFVKIKL